jgi:DNA-binding transcriptional regulator/RsmH inhibitor MraZ
MNNPFEVKDCALLAISTGLRAQNLREFKDHLETVEEGCIYYHFWGGLLRPSFDNPEFPNDFAEWALNALHDVVLAERLAVIVPSQYESLEVMRRELLDVVEERLDEVDQLAWTARDQQFHFVHSQIVIFDTKRRIADPNEFKDAIAKMSNSSLFYHFIDARRRTQDERDDFTVWLSAFGDTHQDLIDRLALIDPYFSSLTQLRKLLVPIFNDCLQEV